VHLTISPLHYCLEDTPSDIQNRNAEQQVLEHARKAPEIFCRAFFQLAGRIAGRSIAQRPGGSRGTPDLSCVKMCRFSISRIISRSYEPKRRKSMEIMGANQKEILENRLPTARTEIGA